ncbi:hypothetical protein PGT21_007800 [Puccinia graminis f. sp. tritici]|uniref:Uncharacterized protein n=1 Tax=Puccinia graminis f. sp. tritici TaxID=56615 RepID=A0A5B0MGU9_PUCGR|nr:hypothetical protein PGT21_007800 [Puccinia graminis f. sp. tritici]KAA1135506.1 hypothetical protein PGTUg99_008962 [Puccinia graminis f. sp. tritici]
MWYLNLALGRSFPQTVSGLGDCKPETDSPPQRDSGTNEGLRIGRFLKASEGWNYQLEYSALADYYY